jgi:hypothetical protein
LVIQLFLKTPCQKQGVFFTGYWLSISISTNKINPRKYIFYVKSHYFDKEFSIPKGLNCSFEKIIRFEFLK